MAVWDAVATGGSHSVLHIHDEHILFLLYFPRNVICNLYMFCSNFHVKQFSDTQFSSVLAI